MAILGEPGSSLKHRGSGAIGDQVRRMGIVGGGKVVRSGDNWDGRMRERWVGRSGEDIVAAEELESS